MELYQVWFLRFCGKSYQLRIRFTGILLFTFFTFSHAVAQHQEISEKPEMYKGKQTSTKDSTSLLYAFKSGTLHGHFRYFLMATDNSRGLTDYHANAMGGGIRYETARFHGFQVAVSGFYIFNIGSSDLSKPDSLTGQYNRYEIALFDVEDASNKKDLDRLEELYLKYNYRNSSITFGRQLINTPFINLQDGRMRPTGVEGVMLDVNELKNTRIEAAVLYAISPRGTVRWYNPGSSIGVYPSGVNPDGTKSGYAGNISSRYVALLGITVSPKKQLKLQAWNMFTENVFNTAMLQADASFPLRNKSTVFTALQAIRQDAVKDGGNSDQSRTFMQKGAASWSFGVKAGWKNKQFEASLNYNRITKAGRYLVPREWGREPFFTFLPRERNEGYAGLNAVMIKLNYHFIKARVKTSLAAGYYDLPDVRDYFGNKYGMPSYYQVNADIRYSFAKLLNGLEAQLLVVGKSGNGETYGAKRYIINKVDMLQYNLVLNFHF